MKTPNQWRKKFYPVPAQEVKGTPIDFIKHSLNKWKGLRELDQYGLEVNLGQSSIHCAETGDMVLWVDAHDCSLCHGYKESSARHRRCHACPIFQATGDNCYQEYEAWDSPSKPDPEPMIELLEKTLQFYEAKEKQDENP